MAKTDHFSATLQFENRRLKYSSMMSIDGNFHLQRNNKGVKKDSPLTGNAGFWVDDGELADYIDGKGARAVEQELVRGLFPSEPHMLQCMGKGCYDDLADI